MKLPAFIADTSIAPAIYYQQIRQWCDEMLQDSPVMYDEDNNIWLLFRHADSARMLNDYATFSSEQFVNRSQNESTNNESLITTDPPRHRQLRSLVTQAFSARTIGQMAPRIEQIVDRLLDKIQEKEQADWMQEFANPLPVLVIAEMLGMPAEHWQPYKRFSDAIINKAPDAANARMEFAGMFQEVIEQRRRQPTDDIMSKLIASEVEGEKLGYAELMGFCFTLFIAGNITTTNVLGNTLLLFDAHPEAFARLKRQPELAPSTVEEILRHMPPGRIGSVEIVVGRVATKDVEIGGQVIRQGEFVNNVALANNFDPLQFPDAARFDIQRTPNRHLSFGHGVHFCLGAPLARLELKIALERIVQRLPNLRINHEIPMETIPSRTIFGPQNVPVLL